LAITVLREQKRSKWRPRFDADVRRTAEYEAVLRDTEIRNT
jgi:hypothetical protein